MYGTQDTNINEAKVLQIVIEPVIVFMVTRNSWFAVPTTGWDMVGTGSFLGPDFNDVVIYEKFFEPGTYYMDDVSSYYLFTKGKF